MENKGRERDDEKSLCNGHRGVRDKRRSIWMERLLARILHVVSIVEDYMTREGRLRIRCLFQGCEGY